MIEVLDSRFAPVAQGSGALERLCTSATWSEGPVWMFEDHAVLRRDIPNNRMLRWSGANGALLHCSHGHRAIVRTRFAADLRNPRDEIVVDRCQGQRLNSPNDVVVKSDGSIWFTDPPNGIVSDREKHKAKSELGDCFMFMTMANLIAIPSLIFTFVTARQIISGRTTGVVKG